MFILLPQRRCYTRERCVYSSWWVSLKSVLIFKYMRLHTDLLDSCLRNKRKKITDFVSQFPRKSQNPTKTLQPPSQPPQPRHLSITHHTTSSVHILPPSPTSPTRLDTTYKFRPSSASPHFSTHIPTTHINQNFHIYFYQITCLVSSIGRA